MKMIKFWRQFSLVCALSIVVGCATQGTPRQEVPTATTPQLTPRGTMVVNEEYEFIPPPSSWEMLTGSQFSHYVVGYYRKDSDKISLASSFIAYDEDPFGTSRDLEVRSQECLKKYFWASMFQKKILEERKLKVLGGEGLAVTFEIKDTTKKIKVKSKLVFGYRGERIVLFYINQWRAIDSNYDNSAFETFDTFVKSFTFLKKSFYETL